MFPIKFNDVTLLPFQVMDDLFEVIELDKTIDKFFKSVSNNNYPYNYKQLKDGTAILEFAFAGFKKEEISVKIDGNTLLVSAQLSKEISKEDKEVEVVNNNEVQIYHGISKRNAIYKFTLASNLDVDKINSKYVNGLLTVTIPTIKKSATVDINIED